MLTKTKATVEDLYHVPENGKAELVHGEIVREMPTGGLPAYAGGEIFGSLREYARRTKSGRALPDNVGYRVRLPNRESFSPDVSFYSGQNLDMRFIDGAPLFAVEIRSEGDYGPVMEAEMEQKRLDYFAAGTEVVWDVDLRGEETIRKYVAPDAAVPQAVYRRGDDADAAPVLSGWTMPVDDLFP
jgi:Uma2 family endonuclease